MSPCAVIENGAISTVLVKDGEIHSIGVPLNRYNLNTEIRVISTKEGFTLEDDEADGPRFIRKRYAYGVDNGVARSVSVGNGIVIEAVPQEVAEKIRTNFQNP